MNTFITKKNFSPINVKNKGVQKNRAFVALFKRFISKRLLLILAVFFLSFLVLTHPSLPKKAVTDSLLYCLTNLIPSLFPFMIAGELLIYAGFPSICQRRLGKIFQMIFGISGKGTAAFIIGAFCGFPVGGKTAVTLYQSGDISIEDAEKLSGICNNCGIGFLISGVGAGLWGSLSFGIILYLSQIFAAILTGVLLFGIPYRKSAPQFSVNPIRNVSSPQTQVHALRSPENAFSLSGAVSSAVTSSFSALLKVIGLVMFFEIALSVIGNLLCAYSVPTLLTSVIFAFTEITAGTKSLYSLSLLVPSFYLSLAKILTFTFSAFGGISVYMQFCAIAIPAGVETGTYIKTKLVQAAFSTLIGTVFVFFGTI